MPNRAVIARGDGGGIAKRIFDDATLTGKFGKKKQAGGCHIRLERELPM